MFLSVRTVTNYLLLPTLILLLLWLIPYSFALVFKRKFFINPTIGLNFSLDFLFFGGLFMVLFKDPAFYSIFAIFGLVFLSKYFFLHKNKKYFSDFSAKDSKIVFGLLLISALFLSFSELIKDYPLTKNSSFRESTIDFNQDLGENYLTYEGDYIIPFNSVRRYLLGRKAFSEKILHIYNVTDRTPFLYFTFMPLLALFARNFFVFQMICVVISILFIVPAYLISREFLNRLDAVLGCLALSFSHFFLFVSTFGQTKTITLFFILTAVWLIIKLSQKNIYLSAVLSSIVFAEAYFSHQFSLIYYLAGFSLFFIIILKRLKDGEWKSGKDFKKALLTLVIFLIPLLFVHFLWNGFASFIIKTPNLVYQNVIFSPTWAEAGPSIKINRTIGTQSALSFIFSKDFWLNKYYNLLGLFVFDPNPEVTRLFTFREITLSGALGIFLGVFFVLSLFKISFFRFRILFFFLLSVPILAVLYQGFYIRMGLLWYILGIIPLMTIIAFSFTRDILKSDKMMILFANLIIVENLYIHFIKERHNIYQALVSFIKSQPVYFCFFVLLLVWLYFYLINEGKKNFYEK